MKPDDNHDELGDEELGERISEQGERVFWLYWDSGAPGIGAGADSIYKFKNQYWNYSFDNELVGPFDSLDEAMQWPDFLGVTGATECIYCSEFTAPEVASRLEIYDAESGHRVQINDEEWEVSPDGRLERVYILNWIF